MWLDLLVQLGKLDLVPLAQLGHRPGPIVEQEPSGDRYLDQRVLLGGGYVGPLLVPEPADVQEVAGGVVGVLDLLQRLPDAGLLGGNHGQALILPDGLSFSDHLEEPCRFADRPRGLFPRALYVLQLVHDGDHDGKLAERELAGLGRQALLHSLVPRLGVGLLGGVCLVDCHDHLLGAGSAGE